MLKSHRRSLLALLTVCVALIAWRWATHRSVPTLEVAVVCEAPLIAPWSALGYVECRTAHVAPPGSARIVQLLVDEGDTVGSGQPLAYLASERDRAGVLLQKEGVNLASAQAAVAAETLRETAALQKTRIQRALAEVAAAQARWQQARATRERTIVSTDAGLAAANAQATAARAELADLRAGSRPEEREQAEAEIAAAEATAQRLRNEALRQRRLYDDGAVARTAIEAADEALARAEATLTSRRAALTLLKQGARPEQIAAARARVLAAEAQRDAANGERSARQWEVYRVREAAAVLEAARAALAQARAESAHLETLRREGDAASARVRQAGASLRQARSEMEERTLRAPFRGVISRRHVQAGEVALPSQPLFTLMESDRLWITAEVDEQDLSPVRAGQAVDVAPVAYPGEALTGVVAQVGDEAAPQTEVRTGARIVRVRIALPPAASRLLKPGMEVQVTGRTELARRALHLPSDALLSDRDGAFVWIVADDDRVRKQRIRTGFSAGRDTEVRQGLRAGQRVVAGGTDDLSEGALVRVRERAP